MRWKRNQSPLVWRATPGGVITENDVPDRTGRPDNIVLALNTLREYATLPLLAIQRLDRGIGAGGNPVINGGWSGDSRPDAEWVH
jgi:hypothetical protein